MDEPISIEQFRKWGSTGGKKRMGALTPAQRKAFSRKGVKARKRNAKRGR